MDDKIKEMQEKVLALFSKEARHFALAGGTALELYYLHHRFSWDLDFFSPQYDLNEIDRLVFVLKKKISKQVKLESELLAAGKAKVRFYTLPVKGARRPLKIDFVEDVFIKKPSILKKAGIRVYSAEDIFLQKIIAITGSHEAFDEVGRLIPGGRNEARDIFDIYMLSKKIRPLHEFLQTISASYQKGLIHWYRTFSRHDLKIALLDMEIYDRQFDSREMIAHLENEIKLFSKEVMGE